MKDKEQNQDITNLKLSGFEKALHKSVDNADLEGFKHSLERGANPYYETNSKDIFDKIEDLKYKEEQKLYDAVIGRNVEDFIDALDSGATYMYKPDTKEKSTLERINELRRSFAPNSRDVGSFMYEQLRRHKPFETEASKTAELMNTILIEHEKERTESYFKNKPQVSKLPSIEVSRTINDSKSEDESCINVMFDLQKSPYSPNNTSETSNTTPSYHISDDESLESLKTHQSKYLNEKDKIHRSV